MTDLTDEQGAAKRQKLDHLVDVNGTHAEADGNQEGFAAATAIQEELQKLAEEEAARVNEIALEFKGRRKDVYDRRSKVLASIKGFWLTVLEHSSIREYVNDYDKTILEYMTSLDVYDDDANSSFTIALSFKPNPFFTNKVLTRTSTRVSEEQTGVTCSEVNWKEGQDLQHYVNEEDGLPLINSYIFMNWFTSEGVYDESAEEGGDQIADVIRGDIWEHPLELFEAEYEEQPEGEGDEEGHLQAHVEAEDPGEEEDADVEDDDPEEGFEEDGSDEDEAAVDEEEDEDEQDAL